MAKKYEYAVVHLTMSVTGIYDANLLSASLSEKGMAGWKLVSTEFTGKQLVFFFMREIEE